MHLSTGSSVDPHSVSVCCAGGMWHGLPGAEKIHSQGPGSQVEDRELFNFNLFDKLVATKISTAYILKRLNFFQANFYWYVELFILVFLLRPEIYRPLQGDLAHKQNESVVGWLYWMV